MNLIHHITKMFSFIGFENDSTSLLRLMLVSVWMERRVGRVMDGTQSLERNGWNAVLGG